MNTEALIEAAVQVDVPEATPVVEPDIEVIPAIEAPAAAVPAIVARTWTIAACISTVSCRNYSSISGFWNRRSMSPTHCWSG